MFQPTRPVRGATSASMAQRRTAPSFNPRAPCGARQTMTINGEEWIKFQPTRPVRGATAQGGRKGRAQGVSTHAPRAGRDVEVSLV